MPIRTDTGANRIESYRGLGSPLKSDSWEIIEMPEIPRHPRVVGSGLIRTVPTGEFTNAFRDPPSNTGTSYKAEEVINRILSVNMTFSNTPSQALYGGGTNTYYSFDVNDIEGITMEFYSDKSNFANLLIYLLSWKAMIVDPVSGIRGYPSNYKKEITIALRQFYSGDDIADTILKYKFYGAFPTSTSQLDFNVSSDPITLSQEFSVDAAEII